MKLTIEHLKGYLGTGLRILVVKDFRGIDVNRICELHTINIQGTLVGYPIDQFGRKKGELSDLKNIKPLLYPLSTLTEFREDLGFVPIVEISGLRCLKGDISFGYENKIFWVKIRLPKSNEFVCKTFPSDANSMEHWIIQKLYEWHTDIHGLIEQGLAIDKTNI